MYFHYKSIKFASLVTSVDKATIVANDASWWVAILFSSLEFYPGLLGWNFPFWPYEQTTKFVPVTETARLPGSYMKKPLKEVFTLVVNEARSRYCFIFLFTSSSGHKFKAASHIVV